MNQIIDISVIFFSTRTCERLLASVRYEDGACYLYLCKQYIPINGKLAFKCWQRYVRNFKMIKVNTLLCRCNQRLVYYISSTAQEMWNPYELCDYHYTDLYSWDLKDVLENGAHRRKSARDSERNIIHAGGWVRRTCPAELGRIRHCKAQWKQFLMHVCLV